MRRIIISLFIITSVFSCNKNEVKIDANKKVIGKSASEILGNPEYMAISYGGYRDTARSIQPTIVELKEDLRILEAMNIKILRTYNVHLPQASNLLSAIKELKSEDPDFEMYVMLGAWINCKNAWTLGEENHEEESEENEIEIARAVELAQQYPSIVKVIAVGNEAMVHWASTYFVRPRIILKWVNYLQKLKKDGSLSNDIWITSSDNYAAWGGGGQEYHVGDLEDLIEAVDYVSIHTYPMHETHWNSEFWIQRKEEYELPKVDQVHLAMDRALLEAKKQFNGVSKYIQSIGLDKPIHIGETGWASISDEFYGPEGSKACDEYKQGIFHKQMRAWTQTEGITCFFFEAFDEKWKDAKHPNGSENHFGLIDLQGHAKYAIWDLVDEGIFNGLSRGGHQIIKSFNGNVNDILEEVEAPPIEYHRE